VVPLHAAYIEANLGVVVTSRTWIRGGLPAQSILDAMGWDTELEELVRTAEVITVFGNPEGLETEERDCIDTPRRPVDCSPDVLEPYVEGLVAIYDRIYELGEGKPIIIRAAESYLPLHTKLRRWGIHAECTACFENYNEAIHEAAGERNVPVAGIFEAFNGPGNDLDAWEMGLIGDDLAHTTEAGQDLIAQQFRQLGCVYTVP